jgi:hypothetical protein
MTPGGRRRTGRSRRRARSLRQVSFRVRDLLTAPSRRRFDRTYPRRKEAALSRRRPVRTSRLRAAAVVVVVIAACGAGSATAAAPRTLAGDGVSVRLPSGWHGKLAVSYEEAVLEAANSRLPAGDDPTGRRAIGAVRAAGVLLLLSEVGNPPGTSGFNPVSLPIRVRPRDVVQRGSRFDRREPVAARRFAVRGRSFDLLVYLGSRAERTQKLGRINRLLASLSIEPYVRPGTWKRLRRPLHLPSLASSVSCPRSRSGRAAPATNYTLGPGNAYPVFGTRHGVAVLSARELRAGAYWHKTLWAISPRYRGPVLVRGRRIDGRAFSASPPAAHVLRVSFGSGRKDSHRNRCRLDGATVQQPP